MPDQVDINDGGFHRRIHVANVAVLNKKISQVFGYGRNQVGGFNDGQQAHEVGQLDHNAALDCFALQETLKHMFAAIGFDDGMQGLRKLCKRHLFSDDRMVFSDQTNVRVGDEFLLIKPRFVQVGEIPHGHFGRA